MAAKKMRTAPLMVSTNDPLNADNQFGVAPKPKPDQGMSAAPNATPPPAATPSKDFAPKIIRDEKTGEKTGVILPNGKEYFGLPPKEIDYIVRKWLDRTQAPAGATFADVKAPPTPLEEQLVTDQLLQQNLSTAQDVHPAISEAFANPNAMDQNIYSNIMSQQNPKGVAEGYLDMINVGKIASSLARKFGGAAGGDLVKGLISTNPELAGKLETYQSEYSNEGNYNIIIQEIGNAKEDITFALALVNDPANRDYAIEKYHKAVARIYKADAQLKFLYDKDPTINRDAVNKQRLDIKNYLDNTLPGNDRLLAQKLTQADLSEVQYG